MKITNEEPITIPPIEAKTFPDLWVYSINVVAPSAQDGRIEIVTCPYNYDTKEILNGEHITITTDKLWQAAYFVPEVAQAMGAIFNAIVPLREWIKTQNAVIPEPSPE